MYDNYGFRLFFITYKYVSQFNSSWLNIKLGSNYLFAVHIAKVTNYRYDLHKLYILYPL